MTQRERVVVYYALLATEGVRVETVLRFLRALDAVVAGGGAVIASGRPSPPATGRCVPKAPPTPEPETVRLAVEWLGRAGRAARAF